MKAPQFLLCSFKILSKEPELQANFNVPPELRGKKKVRARSIQVEQTSD